jgi:hypothetical protein
VLETVLLFTTTIIFLHIVPHLPVTCLVENKKFIICVFLCASVANISNIQQKRSSVDPEKFQEMAMR